MGSAGPTEVVDGATLLLSLHFAKIGKLSLEPEVIHTPARVLLIICMVLQKRKMTKEKRPRNWNRRI